MNKRELVVKSKYEALGWKVLRNGAPDFICLKVDPNGEITDVLAVEVKSPTDAMRYEQEVYKKLLAWANVEYRVEVVS